MNSYCLVLADDYAPFRQVLKIILGEKPGIEVIGEAGDGLQLIGLLNRLSPDMVILETSMPRLDGIEATRWIKSSYPDIKVLVLTLHSERQFLYQALSAGAEGYLLKADTNTELFPAIEVIQKGGIFISPFLGSWEQSRNVRWNGIKGCFL